MAASRKMQVRVTDEQGQWLDDQAASRGTNVSEVLRKIIDRAMAGTPKAKGRRAA